MVIDFPVHWKVFETDVFSDADLNKEQKIRRKLLSSAMSQDKRKRTNAEIFNEACFVRYFLSNLLDRAKEKQFHAREKDLNDFLNELFNS